MEQFIEKVKELRKLQRQYFRARDKAVLVEAKKLEVEVDAMLAEFDRKKRQEPILF